MGAGMSQEAERGALAAQVAAATRLMVEEEILDYSGHIAARVPGSDLVMIQNATDSRAELAPERLLLVDMAGNVVEGDARPPLELALHLEILRARPDVAAVLHCHMELAITFTMMGGPGLQVMRSRAARWASGVPVHPDPSLIRSTEQGVALAQTLGQHDAALIRAHGMVLCAESVPALFVDAVHFQENARQNMLVLQAGQEPLPMTEDEIAMLNGPRAFHVDKLWNFYLRRGRARGLLPEGWTELA